MKRCIRCKEEKSTTEFYNQKSSKDGLHPYCKLCSKEKVKEWEQSHKDRRKVLNRRNGLKRYKLTQEQYDTMLDSQKYVCAICQNSCTVYKNLSVDHCHETDVVRGLLCNKCNQGIGLFAHSVKLLMNAVEYLEGR